MSNLVKLDKIRILELRKKQYWSQEELASATGLSIRTIQRVEKSGKASLETSRALAAVFGLDPLTLKHNEDLPHATFEFIMRFGWLIALTISCVLLGSWVIDILIPTLKGADFNQQYELHGNFRYLDLAAMGFIFSFSWLGITLLVEFGRKKQLFKEHLEGSNA